MNQRILQRIMRCDKCEKPAVESITATFSDRVELSKSCPDHTIKDSHEWGEGATLCKRRLINADTTE